MRFDADGYRRFNVDLPDVDLFDHFVRHGIKEGRTFKLDLPTGFDPTEYRRLNRDLERLSDDELCVHWMRHGRYEQRAINTESVRVLLVSTQRPGFGGASSLAYAVHQSLPASWCWFYDVPTGDDRPDYDPDGTGRAFGGEVFPSEVPEPDVVFAFNYLAPVVAKRRFPRARVIWYVTGNSWLSQSRERSPSAFFAGLLPVMLFSDAERTAAEFSDAIVPNSALMHEICSRALDFVGSHDLRQKLTDPAWLEFFFLSRQPCVRIRESRSKPETPKFRESRSKPETPEFRESRSKPETPEFRESRSKPGFREYHLVAVASMFDRPVKNGELLRKIFLSPELTDRKKLCLGSNARSLFPEADDELRRHNIELKGLVSVAEVSQLLAQSRALVLTSSFESCSIALLQGISAGCHVICTKEVGASWLLPESDICSEASYAEFMERLSLTAKFRSEGPARSFRVIENRARERAARFLDSAGNWRTDKKVLVVSVDLPYYGGCGTNSYRILSALRRRGVAAWALFIHESQFGSESPNPDPDNLERSWRTTWTDFCMDFQRTVRRHQIELVLAKNYKAAAAVSRAWGGPLIFSPSGLACESGQDHQLERRAIESADLVLANSVVLAQALRERFPHCVPEVLDLTYVDYRPIEVSADIERFFDVAFVSWSWSREVKNSPLVIEVLKQLQGKSIRTLVVGRHQEGFPAAFQVESANPTEILRLFAQTKVLAVCSSFDASPNVLREALSCGCRAVVGKYVGFPAAFASRVAIVEASAPAFVAGIERQLKHPLDFGSPSANFGSDHRNSPSANFGSGHRNSPSANFGSDIVNRLMSICSRDYPRAHRRSAVYIHKIPPTQQSALPEDPRLAREVRPLSAEQLNERLADAYFQMMLDAGEQFADFHSVTIDPNAKGATVSTVHTAFPAEPRKIFVWTLTTASELRAFRDAGFYLLRGMYPEFYRQFVDEGQSDSERQITWLYPATALSAEETRPRTSAAFDLVLYDEPTSADRWRRAFPGAKMLCQFFKPVPRSSREVPLDLPRIYDFVYVAANQPTKNPHLFFGLVDHLRENRVTARLLYVGDEHWRVRQVRTAGAVLEHRSAVPQTELMRLFAQCRYHLVFSGRDCFPRVIPESACCGCYQLVSDTLSDGKSLILPEIGKVLTFPEVEKLATERSSWTYKSDPKVYARIAEFVGTEQDHQRIGQLSREIFDGSIVDERGLRKRVSFFLAD
ncbi:MAG: glycosyltransferase family protein [Sulfobacillus sp.]